MPPLGGLGRSDRRRRTGSGVGGRNAERLGRGQERRERHGRLGGDGGGVGAGAAGGGGGAKRRPAARCRPAARRAAARRSRGARRARRKRSGRSGRVPHGRCTLPGSTAPAASRRVRPARTVTVVVPALKAQKRPELRVADRACRRRRAAACAGWSSCGSCCTKSPMSGSEERNSYSGVDAGRAARDQALLRAGTHVRVGARRVRVAVRARDAAPAVAGDAAGGRGPGTAPGGCGAAACRRAACSDEVLDQRDQPHADRRAVGARVAPRHVDLREQEAAVAEQRVGLVRAGRESADAASGSRACPVPNAGIVSARAAGIR